MAERRAVRQHEQLRRLLYTSLSAKEDRPLLLPLTPTQKEAAEWVEVDLQVQLILAQILRTAVLPWYSKLTNDKDFYEEVTRVVKHSLQQMKEDLLLPCEAARVTRLERFILLEVPGIVHQHYLEVRRAVRRSAALDNISAASFYSASNPHPALSIVDGQIKFDEGHIDVILLAMLQRLLPKEHSSARTEVLIVIDVIKGLTRGQLRVRGNGAWVIVRMLLTLLEKRANDATQSGEVSDKKTEEVKQNAKTRLYLGSNFVIAVFKMFFLYIATFYLELFSPITEPKKRSKKRRRDPRSGVAQRWNLLPILDAIAEILGWNNRSLTRFVEECVRVMLVWGGDWLVERLVKGYLNEMLQPAELRVYLTYLFSVLPTVPNPPPPPAAIEPSIEEQERGFDELVNKLLLISQSTPAAALLLGRDDAEQKKAIVESISPILGPPDKITSCSVTQVANARLFLVLLERIALLLNPTLEV